METILFVLLPTIGVLLLAALALCGIDDEMREQSPPLMRSAV
jgi:hypothetical protein